MDIRVYVGNLAKTTTQEEINTLFATAGTVTSVDLVKDKAVRVVSVSSLETFMAQPDALRDTIAPPEARIIACEAGRHPFPPMHPEVRRGLIDIARRLDPLVLRWRT